jgi:hypothetical protein
MIDISQYILTAAVFVERYTDVILHFTFPILFPTKIGRVVIPYLLLILCQFLVVKETCYKVTTLVFGVSFK